MSGNLRFSFASAAIVRDSKGRYLLGVNKNALEARGEIVLTPVGGKVGIDPSEERHFTKHGAVFASTIAPDPATASLTELAAHKYDPPMTDLVFTGPAAKEELFCSLFQSLYAKHFGTVRREMREELVDETRTLRQKHLRYSLDHSHVGRETAKSARAGGADTVRLMSFFTVDFLPDAQARLERFARRRPLLQRVKARHRGKYTGPLVYFATEEEIRRGRTTDGFDYADGAEIASITKTMLRA